MSRPRSFHWVLLGAALATAALLVGCGSTSKRPGHIVRLLTELRRPYISMRAADAPAGSEFDRVPLDLWGPFRWEVTFGAFDPARTAGLENTYFGTELDSRGTPTESYYGIYANLRDGGVYVYVEYEEQTGGLMVLPGIQYAGVVALEAAIEHDGANLRFYVRPRGSTEPFDELGSLPFSPQPFPLNPGIGSFDFTGDAEVGFTEMRVVSNSEPPEPVDEAHAAFNAIFEAISPLAEARYALTAEEPDPQAAAAHLAAAGPCLAAAKAAVAAVKGEATSTRRARRLARRRARRARRALRRARRKIARTQRLLTRRGAAVAPRVLRAIAGNTFGLVSACDQILPPDLRDALPGDHTSFRR